MSNFSVWARVCGLLLLLGVVACAPDNAIDRGEPDEATNAQKISDSRHDASVSSFWFLPPLVSDPGPTDPQEITSSEVEVVELDEEGEVIRYVASWRGADVRFSEDHYKVSWHTDDSDLVEGMHYQIRVYSHGNLLGYADIDVVGSKKELRNVDTNNNVGLVEGKTLPIQFRFGQAAVDADFDGHYDDMDNCPDDPNEDQADSDPDPNTPPGDGTQDDFVDGETTTARFLCTSVEVTGKAHELSNVRVWFADGTHQKFDGLGGHIATFAGTGEHAGKVITAVSIKAANNFSDVMACPGCGEYLVNPNPGACLPPGTYGDGVGDVCDNCPATYNPEQTNSDEDPVGDACDVCPQTTDDQSNSDSDPHGDACDNCISDDNPEQIDTNGDGIGNVCQCNGVVCEQADCWETVECDEHDGSCFDPTFVDNAEVCDNGEGLCHEGTCQPGGIVIEDAIVREAVQVGDYIPAALGPAGVGCFTLEDDDPVYLGSQPEDALLTPGINCYEVELFEDLDLLVASCDQAILFFDLSEFADQCGLSIGEIEEQCQYIGSDDNILLALIGDQLRGYSLTGGVPGDPTVIATGVSDATGLIGGGGWAWVGFGSGDVGFWSLSGQGSGSIGGHAGVTDMVWYGGVLYVAYGSGGIAGYDVRDPFNPIEVLRDPNPVFHLSFSLLKKILACSHIGPNGECVIRTYYLGNPEEPQLIEERPCGDQPTGLSQLDDSTFGGLGDIAFNDDDAPFITDVSVNEGAFGNCPDPENPIEIWVSEALDDTSINNEGVRIVNENSGTAEDGTLVYLPGGNKLLWAPAQSLENAPHRLERGPAPPTDLGGKPLAPIEKQFVQSDVCASWIDAPDSGTEGDVIHVIAEIVGTASYTGAGFIVSYASDPMNGLAQIGVVTADVNGTISADITLPEIEDDSVPIYLIPFADVGGQDLYGPVHQVIVNRRPICDGLDGDAACNGDSGDCIADGLCSCANAWTGDVCGVCPDNWTGPDCDLCANGWEGPDCDVCPDNWTGTDCDVCASGWEGPACDDPDCGDEPECNERGTCADGTGAEPACTCQSGWMGNECQYIDCSISATHTDACGTGDDQFCTDLQVDDLNCGTCGNTCIGGEACNASICEPICAPNETLCGGECIDTSSDESNCGGCADDGGEVCQVDQTCEISVCVADCSAFSCQDNASCGDLDLDGFPECTCDQGYEPDGDGNCLTSPSDDCHVLIFPNERWDENTQSYVAQQSETAMEVATSVTLGDSYVVSFQAPGQGLFWDEEPWTSALDPVSEGTQVVLEARAAPSEDTLRLFFQGVMAEYQGQTQVFLDPINFFVDPDGAGPGAPIDCTGDVDDRTCSGNGTFVADGSLYPPGCDCSGNFDGIQCDDCIEGYDIATDCADCLFGYVDDGLGCEKDFGTVDWCLEATAMESGVTVKHFTFGGPTNGEWAVLDYTHDDPQINPTSYGDVRKDTFSGTLPDFSIEAQVDYAAVVDHPVWKVYFGPTLPEEGVTSLGGIPCSGECPAGYADDGNGGCEPETAAFSCNVDVQRTGPDEFTMFWDLYNATPGQLLYSEFAWALNTNSLVSAVPTHVVGDWGGAGSGLQFVEITPDAANSMFRTVYDYTGVSPADPASFVIGGTPCTGESLPPDCPAGYIDDGSGGCEPEPSVECVDVTAITDWYDGCMPVCQDGCEEFACEEVCFSYAACFEWLVEGFGTQEQCEQQFINQGCAVCGGSPCTYSSTPRTDGGPSGDVLTVAMEMEASQAYEIDYQAQGYVALESSSTVDECYAGTCTPRSTTNWSATEVFEPESLQYSYFNTTSGITDEIVFTHDGTAGPYNIVSLTLTGAPALGASVSETYECAATCTYVSEEVCQLPWEGQIDEDCDGVTEICPRVSGFVYDEDGIFLPGITVEYWAGTNTPGPFDSHDQRTFTGTAGGAYSMYVQSGDGVLQFRPMVRAPNPVHGTPPLPEGTDEVFQIGLEDLFDLENDMEYSLDVTMLYQTTPEQRGPLQCSFNAFSSPQTGWDATWAEMPPWAVISSKYAGPQPTYSATYSTGTFAYSWSTAYATISSTFYRDPGYDTGSQGTNLSPVVLYDLTFNGYDCPTGSCGDGVVDPGEACDGMVPNGTCSSDCRAKLYDLRNNTGGSYTVRHVPASSEVAPTDFVLRAPSIWPESRFVVGADGRAATEFYVTDPAATKEFSFDVRFTFDGATSDGSGGATFDTLAAEFSYGAGFWNQLDMTLGPVSGADPSYGSSLPELGGAAGFVGVWEITYLSYTQATAPAWLWNYGPHPFQVGDQIALATPFEP